LDGTVVAGKAPATAHFDFGTSTAYGSQTPAQPAGSSTIPASVSAGLGALKPSTTYHYRLVANNVRGTSPGLDRTFTTTSAGSPTIAVPAISGVHMSHRRWRLGAALPRLSRKVPVGTSITFRLDADAVATLSFRRVTTGHRAGKRCVAGRPRAGGRSCKRLVAAGALKLSAAHSGLNSVRFQGRLTRKRKLKPGRYKLTIVAVNPQGGKSSVSPAISFTILPALR